MLEIKPIKLKQSACQESVTSESSTVTELEVFAHDDSGETGEGDPVEDVEEGEAEEVELKTDYVIDHGGSDNIDDIVQDLYLTIGPHGWDSTEEDDEEHDDEQQKPDTDTTGRSKSIDEMDTLPMDTEQGPEWKREHMELQRKLLEENAGGMDQDSVGEVSSDDEKRQRHQRPTRTMDTICSFLGLICEIKQRDRFFSRIASRLLTFRRWTKLWRRKLTGSAMI
jgi:hypothetical protein